MATINDINNEIDRIENAKGQIENAIEERGVTVPAGSRIEDLPGLIRSIPGPVQADWNQDDTDAPDFIKNKPTLPAAPGTLDTDNETEQTVSESESLSGNVKLHKISKTGNYNDMLNKPTIPAAQQQSDWDEQDSETPSYIKNKPTIPTVPQISTDVAADKNDNDKTASPKAVYVAVHPNVPTEQPITGMLANLIYVFGAISGNVAFVLNTTDIDSSVANLYSWTFETGATLPNVSWPNEITKWVGNCIDTNTNEPALSANKSYEISVFNGKAVIIEF